MAVSEVILAFHKALPIESENFRSQCPVKPYVGQKAGPQAKVGPPSTFLVSALLLSLGQDLLRPAPSGVPVHVLTDGY